MSRVCGGFTQRSGTGARLPRCVRAAARPAAAHSGSRDGSRGGAEERMDSGIQRATPITSRPRLNRGTTCPGRGTELSAEVAEAAELSAHPASAPATKSAPISKSARLNLAPSSCKAMRVKRVSRRRQVSMCVGDWDFDMPAASPSWVTLRRRRFAGRCLAVMRRRGADAGGRAGWLGYGTSRERLSFVFSSLEIVV